MNKSYLKLFFAFVAMVVLGYLYFKYDPINNLLFPKCPLYATTGIYCPGCGSQRATHALLHLNIPEVFNSNILFLPAIIIVVLHYSISVTNKFTGTTYTSILDKSKAPLVIFIIVILFFILRNIPYAPFTYLAP